MRKKDAFFRLSLAFADCGRPFRSRSTLGATSVARGALDAGADVVNVVTGLDVPDDLLDLVASRGAALVLNHCRGTPSTTFEESSFTDVVAEVAADLNAARTRAMSFGIQADRILLDPGLGFGKNTDQNFELLSRLADSRAARYTARRRRVAEGVPRLDLQSAAVGPALRVARRRGRRHPRRRSAPSSAARPRRRRDAPVYSPFSLGPAADGAPTLLRVVHLLEQGVEPWVAPEDVEQRVHLDRVDEERPLFVGAIEQLERRVPLAEAGVDDRLSGRRDVLRLSLFEKELEHFACLDLPSRETVRRGRGRSWCRVGTFRER